MRVVLAILLLTISACEKSRDNGSDEIVSCVHDPSAQMVMYADGVVRKSELDTCTYESGKVCKFYSYVSDSRITYTNCN